MTPGPPREFDRDEVIVCIVIAVCLGNANDIGHLPCSELVEGTVGKEFEQTVDRRR